MKRKLDTRSAVALITLSLIGAFLLMLVSASFTTQLHFIRLTSLLFSLIPIFVILTIVLLVVSNSSTSSKSTKPANSKLARVLSAITIGSFVAGTLFTRASTLSIPYNQTRGQFVLENLGTASIFIGFVSAMALIDRQKYIYWPLWGKGDKQHADERQLVVRQRVFEKAYRYTIILAAVNIMIVGYQAERMQKIAPFLVVLSIASMPSVIAAWQKDS